MVDINKHKFFLVQLQKAIYSDIELAGHLGFKGGTALMLFYDLPRFSVDLDFNLLDLERENLVYEKVRNIVLKHGKIFDEAKKFYGSVIVLDYGIGEQKLKIEISNRIFNDRYEIKNLLGINMKVMVKQDMFAHKLCTLLDRQIMANRDIFDCWFFLKNQTSVNKEIVEFRMKMPFEEYIEQCIGRLEKMGDNRILHGMGDLMEDDLKKFVRTKLRTETIELLRFYKEFPILG